MDQSRATVGINEVLTPEIRHHTPRENPWWEGEGIERIPQRIYYFASDHIGITRTDEIRQGWVIPVDGDPETWTVVVPHSDRGFYMAMYRSPADAISARLAKIDVDIAQLNARRYALAQQLDQQPRT
jgi:hypothetical protein